MHVCIREDTLLHTEWLSLLQLQQQPLTVMGNYPLFYLITKIYILYFKPTGNAVYLINPSFRISSLVVFLLIILLHIIYTLFYDQY